MCDHIPTQPSFHPEEDQQEPCFSDGSVLAEAKPSIDHQALLSPTGPRPCLTKPQDGQSHSDYPASDYSNLLSDYFYNHSSSTPATHPHPRPSPSSSHPPSQPIHSPQLLPSRPAAFSRRATISAAPSRLPVYSPRFNLPLLPSTTEAPSTLDAAYSLIAGWGDPSTSVQRLRHSTQEGPLESPYKEADSIPKNESLAGEKYTLPADLHASGANDGPTMTDGLDSESGLPFSNSCHRQSLQQWDYPSSIQDLSLLQSTVPAGLEFQPNPSLVATSTHAFVHSLANSNHPSPASAHFFPAPPPHQPTQSSLEWNLESPYLAYDPCHSFHTQMILDQNWARSRESNLALPLFDHPTPFALPNSPAPAPCHLEPRRVSDPSPVAPIAQRPWDTRQRCSIANIPCHISSENRIDDPQCLYSLKPSYNFPGSCAGSSRHSGSFSTTASHLNPGELPTPLTASFGNEVADPWAQLALQYFEHQPASFGNLAFSRNQSLAPSGSPGHSPSYESKSSRPHSAQDPLPSTTGSAGASGSDLDTESIQADTQTFENPRARVSTLSDTPASSLESFTPASRTQFMGVFRQSGQPPFGPPPHRPISPYAQYALFPSQVEFLDSYQGPSPLTDSFPDSSTETALLPQLGSQEAYIQQQTRLRRLSIMSQPRWPESRIGPMGSSSLRGYHERTEGDLSSSPPLGQSHSRGGLLRKRKSMNKDDLSTHTTVPMQAEQEVSGYQRGGSDETVLRGTSLDNSERMMSQETNDRIGGHSQGSPAYKLSRFGGIGQGKSAHPPGLNGEVKPCDLDMLGVLDETGEIMIPWKQDLRCDEDLYTPMWCRGQNDKKEGFCDMCEGGAWFRLKNSAYWYHKQYFHGVSSTTGHYFYPPKEIKRGFSTANRQQILGMCHECEEWVGFSSIIGTPTVKKNQHPHPHQHRLDTRTELGLDQEDTPCAPGRSEGLESDNASPGSSSSSSKVPTLWYKHAHRCHRHQTCKGAKGRKKAKRS